MNFLRVTFVIIRSKIMIKCRTKATESIGPPFKHAAVNKKNANLSKFIVIIGNGLWNDLEFYKVIDLIEEWDS